jgi:excisionase family DNA binding protein
MKLDRASYTVREFADLLGVSVGCIHKRIRAKHIPAEKRGGLLWIDVGTVRKQVLEHHQSDQKIKTGELVAINDFVATSDLSLTWLYQACSRGDVHSVKHLGCIYIDPGEAEDLASRTISRPRHAK